MMMILRLCRKKFWMILSVASPWGFITTIASILLDADEHPDLDYEIRRACVDPKTGRRNSEGHLMCMQCCASPAVLRRIEENPLQLDPLTCPPAATLCYHCAVDGGLPHVDADGTRISYELDPEAYVRAYPTAGEWDSANGSADSVPAVQAGRADCRLRVTARGGDDTPPASIASAAVEGPAALTRHEAVVCGAKALLAEQQRATAAAAAEVRQWEDDCAAEAALAAERGETDQETKLPPKPKQFRVGDVTLPRGAVLRCRCCEAAILQAGWCVKCTELGLSPRTEPDRAEGATQSVTAGAPLEAENPEAISNGTTGVPSAAVPGADLPTAGSDTTIPGQPSADRAAGAERP